LADLEEVKEHIKNLPLELEVIELDQDTSTVDKAAEALGVEVGQIAKSILLMAKEEPLLIVASGDAKISSSKIKKGLGKKARMAKPEEVKEITGFEVGGVCPFVLKKDIPVYIDASIERFPLVYAAAGTSNTAVPVTYEQLLVLGGLPGDFCEITVEKDQ